IWRTGRHRREVSEVPRPLRTPFAVAHAPGGTDDRVGHSPAPLPPVFPPLRHSLQPHQSPERAAVPCTCRESGHLMPPLHDSLHAKIDEQMDRALHLARLLPEGSAGWAPEMPGGLTVSALLGHLLDCAAGFCAALYAAEPRKLAHFQELRGMPVNSPVAADEF